MKRHLALFFIVFIGINGTMKAQEGAAEEKIGSLIGQSDWFTLAEEYPKLKDKMQSETLKHFAETVIGRYFNQPQTALQHIDWLLANAQEELGFGTVSHLILVKSQILGEQGLYAESADNLSDFLAKIPENLDLTNFPVHKEALEFCGKIRNERKPEVIRPNKDVVIPITIEKTERGQTMYVPVSINGKEYKFIFDTGASSSFVSERFANEIGLRITDESFNIRGIKTSMGKRGTTDSLMIGDIVFKSPSIIIGVDTTIQIDAILGIDFIIRIGETQIYPQKREIVFPIKKTELPLFGRNLLLVGGQPYLKAYSNTERLIFHFDTGNQKTDLENVYYKKHKEKLDKIGEKKNVRRGGHGGIRFIDSYQIPKFPLTVGDCNFELTGVDVLLDNSSAFQGNEDGSLGMDFITTFRKVIINFDDMFVKVEK